MIQDQKSAESPSRACVIVVSDRVRNPDYVDPTGPAAAEWLLDRGYSVPNVIAITNEAPRLVQTLESLLMETEVILACGGTGLGPGDITPQTLEGLSDYCIPGVGELLRMESMKYSRNSYLSRCGGFVRGGRLLLALAGNARAVLEQLSILEDLIPNALLSIQGRCKDRRKTASL